MTSGQETHRLKLTFHYDGTRFHGWQVQPATRTVQGAVEAAVEQLTGRHRTVLAAGRTDAGVHATGQVASVEVPVRWTAEELRRALNAVLPDDVWVREARRVSGEFHPRYHAVARTYLYRVGLDDATSSPFVRPWCWPLREPLDRALLDEAASHLPGKHSFRAFAKSGQPQRGETCTVREARWDEWDEGGVAFTITADRYLHRMVRYLVGTMVDVARERRPRADVPALLDPTTSEPVTSPPAPPGGLFLARVEYPTDVAEPEGRSGPEPDDENLDPQTNRSDTTRSHTRP